MNLLLIESFKRTETSDIHIHPLNPLVIDTSRTIPSLVYMGKSILNDNTCNVAAASQITNNTNNDSISVGDFFAKRGGDVIESFKRTETSDIHRLKDMAGMRR
jgi:hypothetical protein